MDATSERFAADLRWLRGEPSLSQEELAFGAGMHWTQMSPPRSEEGCRDWVVRPASARGVTPRDLIVGIGRAPDRGGHRRVGRHAPG